MNTNVSITAIPGPVRQPLVPLKAVSKNATIAQVEDSLNFEACLKARKEHEDLTLELRDRFRQEFGEVLALSTGCMQCETCAYPNAPCRHPDKRVATVESHGILLMQTVEAMNICFNYGNDTVTYFTLLLFNA